MLEIAKICPKCGEIRNIDWKSYVCDDGIITEISCDKCGKNKIKMNKNGMSQIIPC